MDSPKDSHDKFKQIDLTHQPLDPEVDSTRKYARLDDVVNEELDRIGQGGRWVWYIQFWFCLHVQRRKCVRSIVQVSFSHRHVTEHFERVPCVVVCVRW